MKKWVLKALIQKIISWLPGSHRINFWFQKYMTKGVKLSDDYLQDKLQHARDHLRFARKFRLPKGFHSFELGTGWYPIVPVCMFLAGAKRILSVDLSPLMSSESLRETVLKMQSYLRESKMKEMEPYFSAERRAAFLAIEPDAQSHEALMEALHFEYRVGDARAIDEDNDSFHLMHSNNVFEHIYPEVLEEILREMERVMCPRGIGSHFIDMTDHFAHLDKSITIYNFLRYSDAQWRRIDNSVQPQNRWRIADYVYLYDRLGFQIVAYENRPGSAEQLAMVNLAPAFAKYEPADVAISHAHLVNQK